MILIKMDVKSVFRQVGVDPAGAVNSGCILGDYLLLDLRLKVGWRGSPRWWGVQAQRQTTRESATILAAGVATTARVRVTADNGAGAEPLPESCTVKTVRGRRTPRDCLVHGRRDVGGATVRTGRGELYSVGIDLFSGHGGEGGGGGAPRTGGVA